jgi:tetratricopeptide (TPR) repeat protein
MLDFLGMSDPQRVLERSRKLVGQGKTDRAISTLEKALRGDKEDFDLLLELAKLYLSKGSPREAAGSLKRAYSCDPSRSAELLNQADNLHYESETPIETGAFLFEASVDRRDFEQVTRYLDAMNQTDIANLAERYRQRLESIAKYKSEKEMTPKDVSILYMLAFLLIRSNRFADADALFKKGMEIAPSDRDIVVEEYSRIAAATYGDPKPRIAFGDLLILSGDVKRAIEQYRSAVEFDKASAKEVIERLEKIKDQDPEIERYLSELYIAHSKLDEAVSLVKQAVSSGSIELDDALKKLREVVRLDPDNPMGHLALADAYEQDGSVDQAVSEYKEVFGLDPGLSDALTEKLNRIVTAHPRDVNAVALLAEIYLEQKDIPNTVETLRKGFEADSGIAEDIIPVMKKILEREIENSPALLLLAKAYASRNRIREALLIFDSLVALGEKTAKDALRELLPIVERNKTDSAALTSLVLGLLAVGSFDKSAQVMRGIRDLPEWAPRIMEQVFETCRKRPELANGGIKILSAMEGRGADQFALSMVEGELLALAGDLEQAGEKFKLGLKANPEAAPDVISAFTRLLEKNDKIPSIHMGLANCYLRAGDPGKAAKEFGRVLSLDRGSFDQIVDKYYELLRARPRDTAIRMALVDAFVGRGMWDQVREECDRAQEAVPAEQSAYFLLKKGQSLIEKGLLSQAVPLIGRAIVLDDSLLDDADVLCEKIMRLDPKNTPARLTRARIAGRRADFETAAVEFLVIQKMRPEGTRKIISEVRKLLDTSRTDPHLRFCLGELLLETGSIEEAAVHFEAATEMDESFADRAIVKYEEIIAKRGAYAPASLSLARAYMKRGSYSLATQNLLAALRADPGVREPVLHDLNEILERQPEDTSSRFALADLYRGEGDIRRSVGILRDIAELDPTQIDSIVDRLRSMIEERKDEVSLRYLLADILVKRKSMEPAVVEYEKILETSPAETERVIGKLEAIAKSDSARANRALAGALVNTGRFHEAVEAVLRMAEKDYHMSPYGISLLEKIRAADPKVSRAAVVLGRLLINAGDLDRAVKMLSTEVDRAKDRSIAVDCLLYLSRALKLSGDSDQAKSKVALAFATAQDPKKVYPRLSEIIRSERNVNLSKAIEQLESDPSNGLLKIRVSSSERKAGRPEAAYARLQFAADDAKIEAKRRNELALCLDAMGEPSAGVELLKGLELSELGTGDEAKQALSTMAYLYEKTQHYLSAVSALSELASLDPDFAGARLRLRRVGSDLVVRSLNNRPSIIDGVIAA